VCLVDFLLSGVEKLMAWLGIEPTTLDPNSQPGLFDHLAVVLEMSSDPTQAYF